MGLMLNKNIIILYFNFKISNKQEYFSWKKITIFILGSYLAIKNFNKSLIMSSKLQLIISNKIILLCFCLPFKTHF